MAYARAALERGVSISAAPAGVAGSRVDEESERDVAASREASAFRAVKWGPACSGCECDLLECKTSGKRLGRRTGICLEQ